MFRVESHSALYDLRLTGNAVGKEARRSNICVTRHSTDAADTTTESEQNVDRRQVAVEVPRTRDPFGCHEGRARANIIIYLRNPEKENTTESEYGDGGIHHDGAAVI